jgi:hypothetical protein
MSRVVYIGGFGNGRYSAERVASSLETYYDEPVPFTFSEYVRYPELVQRASMGADLLTHSAGALALNNYRVSPERAFIFNAPLPTTIPRLVWGAVKKTARMHTPGLGLHGSVDVPEVVHYSSSAIANIAAHTVANFGKLQEISKFDAVDAANEAKWRGIKTQVIWTTNDSFYQPTLEDHNFLYEVGIPSIMLEGEHDELPLRPDALLAQILEK